MGYDETRALRAAWITTIVCFAMGLGGVLAMETMIAKGTKVRDGAMDRACRAATGFGYAGNAKRIDGPDGVRWTIDCADPTTGSETKTIMLSAADLRIAIYGPTPGADPGSATGGDPGR